MTHNKIVLVLTQQLDFHADIVIAELNTRKVSVVRFDTADFPLRATLIAHSQADSWGGAIVTKHRTIAFDQLGASGTVAPPHSSLIQRCRLLVSSLRAPRRVWPLEDS